jgi:integrase
VGITTGLREGDICTLRWCEVDTEGGWIVRQMLKTGNTVRIPILPALRTYLETLPRDGEFVLPEHAAMYNDNPSGISYRVRRFLADTLKLQKTRAAEGRTRRVSVRDVHSLRHTFCYMAAIHNVPLPIVQSIVGHVDPAITRMYAEKHCSEHLADQ